MIIAIAIVSTSRTRPIAAITMAAASSSSQFLEPLSWSSPAFAFAVAAAFDGEPFANKDRSRQVAPAPR